MTLSAGRNAKTPVITEAKFTMLLTAALVATVARVFFYLSGSHEGTYLRQAIADVGVTVIVLEVCIVMVRFFTTFDMMTRLKKYLPRNNRVLYHEVFAFTAIGLLITYILTNAPMGSIITYILTKLPKDWGLGSSYAYYADNEALVYMANRPFEPLPIIVEYVSLYVLHHKILSENQALSIMCTLIIAVIVAISDVTRVNKNESKYPPGTQSPSLTQQLL
jgi:hypothetical protein